MRGSWFDDPESPAEALAIAERFQGEWYNGGLSQLFSNWAPEDAALVPTAFRVLDFSQGAEIIERVIGEMGPQSGWQERGHRSMVEHGSTLGLLLGAFDKELSSHSEALDAAIVKFEYDLAKSSGEEMFE